MVVDNHIEDVVKMWTAGVCHLWMVIRSLCLQQFRMLRWDIGTSWDHFTDRLTRKENPLINIL